MTRPFRILGLQQIAIGSEQRQGLEKLWYDLLGVQKTSTYRSESENVDEDIVELGHGPSKVELDLMVPLASDRSPKVHIPALNHLGLWVDDLQSAVAWLSEQGVRFTPGGIRRGASGYDVCFIHPKGNDASPFGGNGVLIELVQAPPEVIAFFSNPTI